MSPSSFDNFTVAQIKQLAEEFGIPGVADSFRRATANTYEKFIESLYVDIDKAVSIVQENPELRADDGEDRLSIELVSILRGMSYDANHEAKIGGHCDITVKGQRNFLWIGEAKIHKDYDYLYKGFQQLTTRYSTGDVGQNCGGMVIYVRNKDAKSVVASWRAHLEKQKLEDYSDQDCKKRPELAFHSSHKHDRSGTQFHVRHIAVLLRFDPQDRRISKIAKDSSAA